MNTAKFFPHGIDTEADCMLRKFWRLPLRLLTPLEWESLCDGCAKCCHDGTALGVRQAGSPCKLLDKKKNICTDYERRTERGVKCNRVTMVTIPLLGLPETCAYRRRYYAQPLETWQVEKARTNYLKKLENPHGSARSTAKPNQTPREKKGR